MTTRAEIGAAAPVTDNQAGATVRPESVDELRALVRGAPGPLLPRGGGSKPALSTPPAHTPATVVETGALHGMLEYNPSEFTFTARAGTPLAAIAAALAEHGQAMVFDPPLVEAGATLGGAVAGGLSGAGRMRYGPLRDFLLGVAFIDGSGDLVRGGGRVVKNAAGLDMARLMVGSLGRLGILTEATFKVFPKPRAVGTLRFAAASVAAGCARVQELLALPIDIEALEMSSAPVQICLRLGGLEPALGERLAQVAARFGGELLAAEAEAAWWREARELAWAPGEHALLRVALAPQQVADLDGWLQTAGGTARYSAGGHVAWLALPPAFDPARLAAVLNRLGATALLLRGVAPDPLLGVRSGAALLARVRRVFDPAGKFLPL